MQLILIFITLNIFNVIIQTFKSLATIKGGKMVAALVNALAYGLYTYVIIFMTADGISTFMKAIIVALCNFVGVFVVKFIEEKINKERLWKITITVNNADAQATEDLLTNISHSMFNSNKYTIFDCYCATKQETKQVVNICHKMKGKMFATENKL